MHSTTTESEAVEPVFPTLKIENKVLVVKGKTLPLYSGGFEYWRLERQRWKMLLERIQRLGFRIISTSLPWSIHEVSPGNFDFGTLDERRDLDSFLTLCNEQDVQVLIRPGPGINVELANFGFPDWVVKDPAIQARSAQDTPVVIPAGPSPFPFPSYASTKFHELVSNYLDILCPYLKRHISTDGPIIGLQIDNELSIPFMNGPFNADYSPGSIRWYHDFLQKKYENVEMLNEAHRTRCSSFEQVTPPRALIDREREALPRYLDWVEFQEYYISRALNKITSLFWVREIRGIFTFHNTRNATPKLPLNVIQVERELDIQGAGLYLGCKQYEQIRKGALYLGATSRLPFLVEAGMGIWPWGPPLNPEDQQYALLVGLMHGFRGFNIQMLVERDFWLGSPISRLGQRRDKLYPFLNRLLDVLETIQFSSLSRPVNILLLHNLECERLQAVAGSANYVTDFLGIPPELLVSENSFNFTNTIQQAYPTFWEALYMGLSRTKIPFQIGDTNLNLEDLSKYKVIFLPTYDFMSEQLQEKILNYVEQGGTAIIGPEIPFLGTDMRTCDRISETCKLSVQSPRRPLIGFSSILRIVKNEVKVGRRTVGMVASHGKGKIVYLGISFPIIDNRGDAVEIGEMLTYILQYFGQHPQGDTKSPSVDEVFLGIRGTRVIFLSNSTNQPQSIGIQVSQRIKFNDAWTGEQLEGRGSREIPLPPYGIRILEVRR